MELTVERALKDVERTIAELAGSEEVRSAVKRAVSLKLNPMDIVESMRRGLQEVGERYERREYFLMELVLAGELAKQVASILDPYLRSLSGMEEPLGKVVIGTVAGDLHDIGKDIVITMLSSVGFSVKDLGVDVSAEKFLRAVREEKPDVLAMSGLLTIVIGQMKIVVDKLKDAGLRDSVKIMVGGRALSKRLAEEVGADAYGRDAMEAVKLAMEFVGSQA